jgi:hypothetical protein
MTQDHQLRPTSGDLSSRSAAYCVLHEAEPARGGLTVLFCAEQFKPKCNGLSPHEYSWY